MNVLLQNSVKSTFLNKANTMYVMIYNTKLSYKIHSCFVQKMSHANKRENSGASTNKYFFGISAKVCHFQGN